MSSKKAKTGNLTSSSTGKLLLSKSLSGQTLPPILAVNAKAIKPSVEVVHPFQLHFQYDELHVSFPKKLLFADFVCQTHLKIVDLKGWFVNEEMFELMGNGNDVLYILNLDHTTGLLSCMLQHLKGIDTLKRISMSRVTCSVGRDLALIFASFKNLLHLNISENKIEEGFCGMIAQSCAALRSLNLSKSIGIDNVAMHSLGQMIARFRQLEKIDLSYCIEFTDEGLLDLVQTGFNILADLNVSFCKQLTTLCLAGLRSKMSQLHTLHINNMNIGLSTYEWISEGCKNLVFLNLVKSPELTNESLLKIGRWCRHLQTLLLNNCMNINDEGIIGFFQVFYGGLVKFDLSGCIQCGEDSVFALAEANSKHSIQDVRINALSRVSTEALLKLYNNAPLLEHFELCCELRSTSSHRKSMIPHLSDAVLVQATYSNLQTIKIMGSFQVTDLGALSLLQKCGHRLKGLDFSYCSNITDRTLEAICDHSLHLESLVLNGCVYVSNVGIAALSRGKYRYVFKELQVNGCTKVGDVSIVALAAFPSLETLSVRNCDYIGEKALLHMVQACSKLQSLEITGLDLVGKNFIEKLPTYCKLLTSLSCENCNLTAKEFHQVLTKHRLPFAKPVTNKCYVEKLHPAVQHFNKYVMQVQRADQVVVRIQRLIRAKKEARLIYITSMLQAKRKKDLRRVFTQFVTCIKRQAKHFRHERQMEAVFTLQRLLPQLYSIRYARLTLRQLRKVDHARRLIQRVYRGYVSRKKTKDRFDRLFFYYRQIGYLVYKYRLIHPIRVAKQRRLGLQSFARMVPKRVAFLTIRYGIVLLQRRFRLRNRFRLRRQLLDDAERRRKAEIARRRNAAARFIQKNWKNRLFNSMMAPFIFFCCIYFRNDYDEKLWRSIQIQKIARGYNVRMQKHRATLRFQFENIAATRIQKTWRMHYCRVQNRDRLQQYHKRFLNIHRFFKRSRPRLRLGRKARSIQRAYRMYRFRMIRHKAASAIQIPSRAFFIRKKWELMIEQIRHRAAGVIQNNAKILIARARRRDMKNRQHMAAYRIFLMVDKFFQVQRDIHQKREDERLVREKAAEMKKAKLVVKRTLICEKIKQDYLNLQARKIQRAMRKFRKMQRVARFEASQSMKSLDDHSLTEGSAITQPSAVAVAVNKLLHPIRKAQEAANKLSNFFKTQELIPKADEKKFTNAVLKYQLKSILQEGIVDLHLTLGDTEYKAFDQMQINRKNVDLPYFQKLPQDLSGSLNLQMNLWYMMGTGIECICEIVVQPRPPETSNSAMKIREQLMEEQFVRLCWHVGTHFEIHGIRSVKQGKAAFAVRQLVLTSDPEEEEVLLAKDYSMIVNFSTLGLSHVTLWYTSRKLEDEDVLFKFSRLTANYWCDDRLLRAVKGFNLSEADVMKMRQVYEDMLYGRNRDTVRVDDVMRYIGYPYNTIAKWSVAAINPDRKGELKFSEYVHYVCYFIMLSARDMTRFLFRNADTGDTFYLKREQFNALVAILADNSPFNVKAWEFQFENFYDKKLKAQFIKNFEAFIHQNSGALWQPQLLQQNLMKVNLGKVYWENKIEQYRVVRLNLGIKLL